MKKNKGKILGVDFGEKHVGLADCDESRSLVFGRGVLENYKSLENLFRMIKAYCDDNNIDLVVFGVPTGGIGEDTMQTERYKKIGKKLEVYLENIKVEYQDEAYSTFEAQKLLHDNPGASGYTDHELAAVAILERFLEKINE